MGKREKKTSKTWNGCYIVTLILGFIVLIVGIYLAVVLNQESAEKRSVEEVNKAIQGKLPPNVTEGWVNVLKDSIPKLSSSMIIDDLLKKIVQKGKPALIRNYNYLHYWPIKQWDLLEIAKKNISLSNCRLQYEPVFVLGQERDKGGMLGSSHDHPVLYINLTLHEFLISTLKPKLWLYWTGKLSYLEKMASISAVDTEHSWRNFRIFEEGVVNDTEANDDIFTPVLWLSHPGVVSQTHYDTQHNVFIQLQGVKRFLLFDPSAPLYHYPNVHRSYRQSQVHLEHPLDRNRFPLANSSQVKAYEVTLHPGDVLYIPPYFQHRVESLSLSLSLSILSPSDIEAAFAEIYWQKVPFGQFQQSRSMRASAVVYYFQQIFSSSSLVLPYSLPAFAHLLYNTRFAPLKLPSRSVKKEDLCPNMQDNEVKAALQASAAPFQSAATNVVQLLSAVKTSKDVKAIFLMDYLEQISRWAVGPELVSSFVQNCFETNI